MPPLRKPTFLRNSRAKTCGLDRAMVADPGLEPTTPSDGDDVHLLDVERFSSKARISENRFADQARLA